MRLDSFLFFFNIRNSTQSYGEFLSLSAKHCWLKLRAHSRQNKTLQKKLREQWMMANYIPLRGLQ